ncbi:MAG: hypothetical protein ABGX87_14375 [Alcanivorax sp.]|uniref:Glucose-inhibited division protein B n=1 Tax=Alloalcanivorax marinus TaxID=1177169 RepID=A0A9Q3YRX8_9GAMM|nr:hypothetical protein [Alloalcanivorax marinus]MCC4309063.1 glucose-inhibited division protein B [Alloalcanivorax marinus]
MIFDAGRRAAALALTVTLSLAGCDYRDAPEGAPLRALAAEPESYQGSLVATSGVVRGFDDPEHYWIEDEALNRVALAPMETARDHLGQRVQVVGTFHYEAGRGRWLEIRSLGPL